MAPKKAKSKMPVDGVDTTSMSREQLEAFCIRLREELDREREERNFFQLERDKLRTFWEITRQQLEESRAQQRNQDRAKDELEEKHQAEIKVYKQKVKHLLYEHECNLSELKVESMVSLKQAQDDYNAMEQQLLKDKKELKEQIHDLELAHLEEVRQLKIDHSAEVNRIREQLESDAAELEKKYETRLTNQAEEQAMREKMEQAELETRKNQHIVDLTKQHEAAFQEMKNYYNDITLNNLALISSLKEQMEELKANHDRMEKQLNACQTENKKLAEPYKQAQSELGVLKRQLATYEQDKVTLGNTKQRLSLITKELEDLRWENDVLELRFEKVEKERDRLHAEFVGAVLDVQQKTGLKGELLEKRMASMRSGVSHKSGVSVTGGSTKSSSCKNTRPATVPLRIPFFSPPDRETMCRRALVPRPLTRVDDDAGANRFESGAIRGRSRFKRPHMSENSKARWIKAFRSSSSRTDRTATAVAVSRRASPRDVLNQIHNSGTSTKERKPLLKDCWWTNTGEASNVTPCVCGQHINGCRVTAFDKARQSVEALDLSFNYFSRNYMKHRYYPQVLDCVRHSLSPIHSQEHPSDVSIHDATDKSMAPQQSSFPQELPLFQEDEHSVTVPTDPDDSRKMRVMRPLSASRADGRDRVFTKRKQQQLPTFRRSSTADSVCDASQVFRDFMRLPRRPDLPWLHGVKSRYSSQNKSTCAACSVSSSTADSEIQTLSPHDAGSEKPILFEEEEGGEGCDSTAEKKSSSDDETQCFLSHILSNPLQLSYSHSPKDRNYAALVATPKIEDYNTFMQTQTEDFASGRSSIEYPRSGLTKVGRESDGTRLPVSSMWYSYKSRKDDYHVLSISSVRHIDIKDSAESVDSSPAIETPADSSREDTREGVTSMSVSQPDSRKSSESKEDRRSDSTLKDLDQMDVENSLAQEPHFLNSWEKRDRVSLKRKLKPTSPKRLKLKLMICSYLHCGDKDGDVNFVHPSVKPKSVETSATPEEETLSFGLGEIKDNLFEYPLLDAEEKVKAVDGGTVFIKRSGRQDQESVNCCVCQSKMASLGDPPEGDQICCTECANNADALLASANNSDTLGEWEVRSFSKEFADLLSNDGLAGVETLMKDLNQSINSGNESNISEEIYGNVSAESDNPSLQIFPTDYANFSPKQLVTADFGDQFSNVRADCVLPESGLVFTTEDKLSAKLADDSYRTELNCEPSADFTKNDGDSNLRAKLMFSKRISDNTTEISTEVDTLSKTKSVDDKHTSKLHEYSYMLSDSVASDNSNEGTVLFPHVDDHFFTGFYERSSGTDAKLVEDTTKFDLPSNAAALSKDFSVSHESHVECCKDNIQGPVVFTLSRVEEAIRSAMKTINPLIPFPVTEPDSPRLPTPATIPTVTTPRILITPDSSDVGVLPASFECETEKTRFPGFETCVENCPPSRAEEIAPRKSDAVASTKMSRVCPLAVPLGTLKGDATRLVYTEVPVQTYSFSSSKLGCVSKPKNLLVFYEVSKIKNKGDVKINKTSVEKEEMGVMKETVCLPSVLQEERFKSVGATANFPRSRNNLRLSEQTGVSAPKSAPPCESRFDLIMRRRRESCILTGREAPLKEMFFPESGRFRHRPEILNEDDIGLPRGRQDPLNANRDKSCMCLKRSRKCTCSLTKLLHICPLPPPRPQRQNAFSISPKTSERALETVEPPRTVTEKYRDGNFKKNVTFFTPKETRTDGGEFLTSKWLSRARSPPILRAASPKTACSLTRLSSLGRPEKSNDTRFVETMPSLVEEPLSGHSSGEEKSLSQFVDANTAHVPSVSVGFDCAQDLASPRFPTPPPPSPNASFPSPPSSRRTDRLPKRTGNVSFQEDGANPTRFLPQLPLRIHRQSQDDSSRKKT